VALAAARRTISRTDDRRVTFGGVAIAVALLALALTSVLLPAADRRGLWLPLHLGLAGGAGTAVAAVLPFFTAALAVARPVSPVLRVAAVGLIAGGAVAVSIGVVAVATPLAVGGGLAYLAGLGAVAAAAFGPLRGALGPRRRLVEGAYAVAIVQVVAGVGIATAMVAGATPVLERWALLKPAHGWLNVFGFLSLIVAATLLHLAPTVAGTRIRPRRSAVVAVVGLGAGATLVALGFTLGFDALARAGAAVEVTGAVGLVTHALGVQRERGRWTTDPAWHRLTSWSLLAAPVWLLVAVAVAAGRVLWLGADPAAWSLDAIAAPLAIGWLGQVLIGSWSHLLPAIGPGDIATHARQRVILGRAATPRLTALNAGVVAIVVGIGTGATALVVIGLALALGAIGVGVVLFGLAATRAPARTPAVRPA
jgi:nitrite reductase (NO-forming)